MHHAHRAIIGFVIAFAITTPIAKALQHTVEPVLLFSLGAMIGTFVISVLSPALKRLRNRSVVTPTPTIVQPEHVTCQHRANR